MKKGAGKHMRISIPPKSWLYQPLGPSVEDPDTVQSQSFVPHRARKPPARCADGPLHVWQRT